MGRHYGQDRLVECGTGPLPETTPAFNPAWRRLDQAVRRPQTHLESRRAQRGAINLIAYRAETALVQVGQEKPPFFRPLPTPHDAQVMVRTINVAV
jgi:hypothetical protein